MKITITDEWLAQFGDDDTVEPSGYLTPRDREELERRRRERRAATAQGTPAAPRLPRRLAK